MSPDALKKEALPFQPANGTTKRQLRAWWILYGLGLVMMALVTPPFQVPDEPNHFFRVYQLSEGHILAQPRATGSGGLVPRSLKDLLVITARGIPFNPQAKFAFERWLKGWNIPANEQDRCFLEFANTGVYSPLVYISHVFGLRLARAMRWPPLAWMYAARIAGALSIWLVAGLCMRVAPARWRPVFLLLLMAPMFMFEAAGIAADGMTNITAFIFTAAVLNATSGENILTRKQLVLLTGLASALALCKPPYVLLVILLGLVPARRFESFRERLVWIVGTLIFVFSLSAAWNLAVKMDFVWPSRFKDRTDPILQMAFIREHPRAFVAVLMRTLKSDGGTLLEQWVGRLGWLDVRLPPVLIGAYYMVFFLLAVSSPRAFPQPWWGVTALLAIPVAGSLLTLGACYTTFTPVRHPVVLGFQGRYFIPWGPLVAAVLAAIPWRGLKNVPDHVRCRVAMCVGGVSFLVAVIQLVRRYYIP